MRLIDADELIEGRVENDPVRIAAECAPTAFDKEKVIEELKARTEDSRKYWIAFDDEDAFGEMNAYRRAIEIVEKGGIE